MELSSAARKILNDPKLIEQRDLWFTRLEHVFENVPDPFTDTQVFAVNGILGEPADPDRIYSDPTRWVKESLEDLAERAEKSVRDDMFVPACIESAMYGVHFIDKIFGCEVWFQDGQWYNKYCAADVGRLKAPDLESSVTWRTAKAAALEFVRQEVKLPLFGLPTIASALNIGVNLYGESILADLLMEPELAFHDFSVINDTLCTIHRWYRKVIPCRQLQPVISWNRTQPPGYGQLCGCTLQLISDGLYADLSGFDEKLLLVYPNGGMIHLCGRHEHLIPIFRGMKSLKALQLNDRAAADLRLYYEGLREDQILYLNPCTDMTIEMAMEITGGDRLVIADTVDGPVLREKRRQRQYRQRCEPGFIIAK